MYVVATAGHVDHGKSTLVRALTGMEPDRWAEERRRGMTIDLGYAWLTLPSGEQLAFVDVPGHERFVPNMLAGLGPVPAVVFVVAADGGWMPQSAEHLAAVDALGVSHGLLVITRADLADPAPAARQALAEIARTSLGTVEAIPVSAVTGQGMDDLRAALSRLTAELRSSGSSSGISGAGAPDIPDISTYVSPASRIRLWIDRSFTIRGAGTVVTGTLPAGTVRNGQELLLTPSGQPVRVRGLQALGEPADQVTGVARVALNLRGVPADLPERGMALIEPGQWTLTSELDVRLTAGPAGAPGLSGPSGVSGPSGRSAKFPPELLVHIGAARTGAALRVLGTTADAVYLRLRLTAPLPLHAGDRLLLRDPGAATLAIYGATVLDPFPPPLARRGAAAAATRELAAWPDSPAAADLLRRHHLLRAAQLTAAGLTELPPPVTADWLADPAYWDRKRAELADAVAAFCAKDPLAPGMPAQAARAALGLPARDLIGALAGGDIVQDGGYLRIFTKQMPDDLAAAPVIADTATVGPATAVSATADPATAASATAASATAALRPGLPPRIAAAVATVLGDLAKDPFGAPDTERLRELGLDAKALATAARGGLLLRVADLVVLAPGADKEAARLLAALDQPFTTSQARQALGTSRRVAIPLLEYLDRARVTERLPGDLRRLRG
jgi:selenocysteine-specific elongation factor